MREAFGARGGQEIDTQGDAFFFSFPRARDAVAAAVAAQRAIAAHEWPDGEHVLVRMGLHTGEPALGEEGYLGIDVVRAARISAAGHGGQILLSETTRALVGSDVPAGTAVHPLGEQRLKDLPEPERIYEVAVEGVAVERRPLRTERTPDLGATIEARVMEEIDRAFNEEHERRARRKTGCLAILAAAALGVLALVVSLRLELTPELDEARDPGRQPERDDQAEPGAVGEHASRRGSRAEPRRSPRSRPPTRR